jgi:nucleoid-associated protein YgaU
VSDVVVRGEVPADVRRSMELWVGCVAGALEEAEFKALLAEVGFEGADIEPTRVYQSADARVFLEEAGIDVAANLEEIDGKFMAGFVRATKPTQPVTAPAIASAGSAAPAPAPRAARPLVVAPAPGTARTEGACCGPDCCS